MPITVRSQEVFEAIILAGGLGTRLRNTIPAIPKCLALVAGRPILSYIIDDLRIQGIRRLIFSLGHQSEMVEAYLQETYPSLEYETVTEPESMGTGGAVLLSTKRLTGSAVVVVNGDTLFKVDLAALVSGFESENAECLIALKPMQDFDRYGSVETGASSKITAFREKEYCRSGLINGGIYLLRVTDFLARPLQGKFSFEKDYLEKYVHEGKFFGSIQDQYFIDIGVPEDFHKAGEDLKRILPDLTLVDKSWSLFLDRDGVINKEILGRYVLDWTEFQFLDGVPEAITELGNIFGKVFIVSNQRGVGKGLMTEETLADIHKEMQNVISQKGGRVDKIYYCTDVNNNSYCRKPNPGMAVRACCDNPSVSLGRSIMVGNKPSDMRFGRSAGMVTVFVTTTNSDQPFPHPDIDLIFPTLPDFVKALKHWDNF